MLPSIGKYNSFESLKSAPQDPVSPEEQARNYEAYRLVMAQIRVVKEGANQKHQKLEADE